MRFAGSNLEMEMRLVNLQLGDVKVSLPVVTTVQIYLKD